MKQPFGVSLVILVGLTAFSVSTFSSGPALLWAQDLPGPPPCEAERAAGSAEVERMKEKSIADEQYRGSGDPASWWELYGPSSTWWSENQSADGRESWVEEFEDWPRELGAGTNECKREGRRAKAREIWREQGGWQP